MLDNQVTVVTALSPTEKVKKTFRGESEWLKVRGYSVSANKNMGWSKAKSPYVLFIDSDIDARNIDVSSLPVYGFDIACAFLNTDYGWDYLTVLNQNLLATIRSPLACNGSFMLVKKKVFNKIGGFNDIYMEDVEFASRAFLFGYKIGSLPFRVQHTRPFTSPLQWISKNISRHTQHIMSFNKPKKIVSKS